MAFSKTLRRLVLAAATFAATSPSYALDLSGQTVTVLVPFGEGGGSDTLARFLQPFLKDALPGKPNVVVLNKPGGGSVTGVNGWVGSAKADGTDILVGSTSSWVPFVFGSSTVKYDPSAMRPVVGFPRVSVFYTNPERTGVKGASTKQGVDELRGATLLKGAEAPLSLDTGDLVALHMLDIPHRAVFGMSTSEQRRAFLNGEVSANNDSLAAYLDITKSEGPERVSPLFVLGGVDGNGKAKRIDGLPDVMTFEELYEATNGQAPSGPEYKTYQVMHYLRTNLAKSIMLPPGTPDDIVTAYVTAFQALERNAKYINGMKANLEVESFVYGQDMVDAFAGISGFGAEERSAVEAYMRETHGVALK
ncbi:MAG: hypothetical protein K9H25_13060 [Rhodospirillum sp.]|nr:hypothetical protein [Rhodospirillum sp.]MCF8489280.1 hypothetical protein [Rhodospirillum sp.]